MKARNWNPMDKPVRVLVVEDNRDDSDLLVRQLHKNNFNGHVKVIADGSQAWECLAEEGLRTCLIAIFLDLRLPSLDGVKLLARIKSHPQLCHLPVFVMTSSNHPDELEECTRLGADECMAKPVTFTAFTKAIADVFHHTTSTSPLARIE